MIEDAADARPAPVEGKGDEPEPVPPEVARAEVSDQGRPGPRRARAAEPGRIRRVPAELRRPREERVELAEVAFVERGDE
jgi:hypothetical protein